MAIYAIIDKILFPSTVSGWAYVNESPSNYIEITAYEGQRPISGNYNWGNQREFLNLNQGLIGFHLIMDEVIDPTKFLSGQLRFEANAVGQDAINIEIWTECRDFLKTVQIFSEGKIPPGFTSEDFVSTIKWLKMTNISLESKWYETFISSVDYNNRGGHSSEFVIASQLSQIFIPKNVPSIDSSALIVADGHAVLVGGSNNVQEMYSVKEDDEKAISISKKWIELLNKRNNVIKENFEYIHIIIPEKTSSLRHLSEIKIPYKSSIFRNIENNLYNDSFYLSIFDAFDGKSEFFRKFDTHFSPYGCWKVIELILDRLNCEGIECPIFLEEVYTLGDLSNRFFDVTVYDNYKEIDPNIYNNPELIMSCGPHRPGGHLGVRRHWINESAPIQKKLFVAGNSFCGTGDNQTTLNWWLSRIFREIYFDFNPSLDLTILDDFTPDVVITQTIERFLSFVPEC